MLTHSRRSARIPPGRSRCSRRSSYSFVLRLVPSPCRSSSSWRCSPRCGRSSCTASRSSERRPVSTYPPPPETAPAATGAASGPRANFGQRLVATIIDSILVGIVGGVVELALPRGLGYAVALAIGIAYFGWLEGSNSGQTIGKRAIDFRVGGPIGTGRAIGRYFARIISAIPCFLGYFWMLWDPEKQCWHDKLVSDVVVPVTAYPVSSWPN